MFVPHHVAVSTYVTCHLRLPVALSPAAQAYNAKHPRPERSCAGLAEVQAAADFKPMPAFILAPMGLTNDDLLREQRKFARRVQLAKELAERLRNPQN